MVMLASKASASCQGLRAELYQLRGDELDKVIELKEVEVNALGGRTTILGRQYVTGVVC